MRRGTSLLVATLLSLGLASAALAQEAPAPRDISDTCDGRDDASFRDVPDSGVHAPQIRCIAGYRISEGFSDGTFRPADPVTGPQLATFLVRTLRAADRDVGASATCGQGVHAPDVGILVDAGVMDDCNVSGPAVRTQMARWVVRSLDAFASTRGSTATDYFDDDAMFPRSTQAFHDAVADLGIAQGIGGRSFGPTQGLTRGQMATFLARTLDAA